MRRSQLLGLALAAIVAALGLWYFAGGAALPAGADLATGIVAAQRRYLTEMRQAVRAMDGGGLSALVTLLSGAFLYGVLHAAGPGHGKAVIASYIVADGATLRRGLLATLLASLAQALSAIVLVGIVAALLGLGRRTVEDAAAILEGGATAALIAIGLYKAWGVLRGGHCGHDHDHDHDHGHAHDHRHGGHGDDHHHHGRQDPAGRGSLLAVALTVGIRPCTGAIVLLLFCMIQQAFIVGVAGTFAMAAGTALTVSALAVLAVYGRRLLDAVPASGPGFEWVRRGVAVLGWLSVALFGALLLHAVLTQPRGLF